MPFTHDSSPTVPIPATEMRRILAAEGREPIPDDETPTSPDLDARRRAPTLDQCLKCAGRGVIEIDEPTHYARIRCTRCKGTKIDPGTPVESDD